MAKNKNRKVTEKTAAIDMGKYDDSKACVEKCSGCGKAFNHVFLPKATLENQPPVPVITSKCLAYIYPKAKWGAGPTVMKEVIVKVKNNFVSKMVPAVNTDCPLATHTERQDVSAAQKVRVGQQKQKAKD